MPRFDLPKKPARPHIAVPTISWNAIPATKRRKPDASPPSDLPPSFKAASEAFPAEKRTKVEEGGFRQGLRKPYVCPVAQQKPEEDELKGQEDKLVAAS